MLRVENLYVEVGGKTVVKDVQLFIKENEVVVLFGPNGSGKTSLVKAIMGFGGYSIKKGRILFKNKDVTFIPIEERVKLGIGLMPQHPPKVRGVKLIQLAEFLCNDRERIKNLAESFLLQDLLYRDVNVDFSGGEIKRSELFQLFLQNPDLLLLDEPESGVDIENISIMGKMLRKYLENKGKSALIITHTGYILDYVPAHKGYVMIEGSLHCVGSPKEIFKRIKEVGYEKCKECKWQMKK